MGSHGYCIAPTGATCSCGLAVGGRPRLRLPDAFARSCAIAQSASAGLVRRPGHRSSLSPRREIGRTATVTAAPIVAALDPRRSCPHRRRRCQRTKSSRRCRRRLDSRAGGVLGRDPCERARRRADRRRPGTECASDLSRPARWRVRSTHYDSPGSRRQSLPPTLRAGTTRASSGRVLTKETQFHRARFLPAEVRPRGAARRHRRRSLSWALAVCGIWPVAGLVRVARRAVRRPGGPGRHRPRRRRRSSGWRRCTACGRRRRRACTRSSRGRP